MTTEYARRALALERYGRPNLDTAYARTGECPVSVIEPYRHIWQERTGYLPTCDLCHKTVYAACGGIAASLICTDDGYRVIDLAQAHAPMVKRTFKTLTALDKWLATRNGYVAKIDY